MNAVRRAAAVLLGAIVYIATLFAYFAVSGQSEYVSETRLWRLQVDLHKVEARSKAPEAFAVDKDDLRARLDALEPAIPAEPDLDAAERDLRRVADSTGLTVASVTPGARVSKRFRTDLPIEVTVGGPNKGIVAFVAEIGRLRRLMTVDNVELESDGVRARARITVVTYCRCDDSPETAIGQDVRVTQNDRTVEIAGGRDGSAWTLTYGRPVLLEAAPRAVASGNGRVFLITGTWLRAIDPVNGDVTGRWRFPCPISRIAADGRLALVRMTCNDPPLPQRIVDVTFDPEAPTIPIESSNSLLRLRDPMSEAAGLAGLGSEFFCLSRPLPATVDVPAAVARLEHTLRHDRLSPWLRIGLATLVRAASLSRADELLNEAADTGPSDFEELFRISACLERLGHPAAERAFDRAYADFLARGNDPRLFNAVITRLMLYYPFPQTGPVPQDTMERAYRLSPGGEGSDLAWRLYAAELSRSGRPDRAVVWQRRAEAAETQSLSLNTFAAYRTVDRALLLEGAASLAGFMLVVALTITYASRRERTLFGFMYWTRRERLMLLTTLAVGWLSAGIGGVYSRIVTLQLSQPMGISKGHWGTPSARQFFERSFWPTSERDLLIAISAQLHGDTALAERMYRALPQFAEAWNNRGVILKDAGKLQEAHAAFERARQIDPGLAEAAWNDGKGPTTLSTELHQKYVPGRPMIAPPSRAELVHASLGMSVWSAGVRAFGGPWVNVGYSFRRDPLGTLIGDPISSLSSPLSLLETKAASAMNLAATITLTLLLLFAGIVLIAPVREANARRRGSVRVLEVVWPGISPRWGAGGGVILLLWSLLILCAVLAAAYGTPYTITFALSQALPRSWGLETTDQAIAAVIGPAPMLLYGAAALLFSLNLLIVFSGRRARTADAPSEASAT